MADFWEQFADAPITTQTNNNSSDNFWEQFESSASQTDLGKLGKPTEMRATPKRNLLMDFKNCLDWVNKTTLAAYQEGKNQTEIARLEMKDMLNMNNQQEANRLEELGRISNKTYQDFGVIDNNFADDNADTKIANLPNNIKKAYIEAVKQLPIMWETIKAGGVGMGVGAVGGAGVGTATGLLTTKANTPQLALQGARVGGAWGGRITGGMKIAEIEGGLARNELKQINQEIIEKGGEPLDKWQIDTLSLAVGGINGGLEYIGLRQVLKTVPGGDKIIEYLEKKNLRELATNKAVREQLKGILGQYAETVATEVSTEMLQETMNIVADETARKLGKVDNTPLEQNVARIIQTGKVTFGATMFLGGTTSAAKATTILAKQGMTKTEAEQAVENMTPQEIDEVVENNLDTLFKSVEDIPTVKEQEDKTKLRDAYFEQIKNTGMEETEALNNATLMSEAFAALAKNTGVNLDDIEKEANIVIQNMSDEQAQQQYETDNSAALSGSITFNDTQENLIETELGRLYEEFSSLPEDYADETDLMNRISNMQILEDLQNGVISEENIQAIQNIISEYEKTNPELATFLKDAAEKVGNILGLNEIEYQKIEQPKYQKIETAGAENNETALARQEWKKKGTESKYFKKWFGDSKVVDKEGRPLVVYHATNAEFDAFDTNKSKKGKGFWFTSDKKYAKEHGNNLYSVYLKSKKLFDADKQEDEISKYTNNPENLLNNKSTQNKLQKDGYDGIVFNKNDGRTYIVFNPEQIKSVDNQGTFDEKNPNIYYQKKIKQAPGQMNLFDAAVQMSIFQQEQIFQPQSETGQDVQLEIGISYDKKDVEKKKKEEIKSSEIITDAGDSLLGNLKKNKKQYTWNELDEMNDLLRKKYLSKSYIYQLPSYDEFKKQGLSDRSIAFIDLIYAKINAKPSTNYAESKSAQKIYFDAVHDIMNKTIDFAKSNDELLNNYNRMSARNDELFKSIFPDTENKNPYNIFTAYPEHNRKAIIVGGNKLVQSLQLGYSTAAELDKIIERFNAINDNTEQAKETVTGWRTKFDVVQTYRGWCVADRKSGMIITSKDLPTKEIAENFADKIYQEVLKNSSNYTENYTELRHHIPRRENNQNVNPEALIEVFGFRGINFGNWTKQQERQDFINLAYDSLYDLAELLNLPPKALSLGGKLGLAFGAQGRSKAAGHFIPEYNEINLTRKSGAGALAHEWWHALDYYFGDQTKGKEFSGKAALSLKEQGLLRKEIFDALANLNEQIKYSPLTEKEIEEKSSSMETGIHRAIEYYANDIKKSFSKSKKANDIAKFVDDIVSKATEIDISAETDNLNKVYMSLLDERRKTWDNLSKLGNLLHYCRKLQQVQDIAKSSKKYSQFYENADLLNTLEKGMGKGYWTSSTELGARAFASYILNKTLENNFTNNFLVRDEKGEVSLNVSVMGAMIEAKEKGEEYKGNNKIFVEWYPAEQEERERIFSAFDNLFSNIKIREENGIPILFQSNNDINSNIDNARGFTYQRKNFDGTEKENLIVLLNKKADKSTLMHEFAHVYLITLNNLAQHNDRAKELLMTVNQWLHYDGVEYTEFQHERFANNFVAYVKSGRAPSYGLKKVFENFRRWLNDMYSELQESENVFIDPETAKVFDELLGNITINFQKEQAEQIYQKARTNAQLRYANELESQKKKVNINQLTDYQKRYRDTAYNILWYALNNSKKEGKPLIKDKRQLYMLFGQSAELTKKNKGVIKQAEKLAEFLAELDDVFSSGDGFLPEWREFFTDTITEDSDDAALAMQALDVIVNRDYIGAYPFEYDEHGNLSEGDIAETNYALDVLIEEYKNADDKTIPLLAFNQFMGHVHLYIQEDIQKKWENATNEIDRYEALDNFEKAKEDLKLYAATLKGYGDYSTQFAEYARKIVKRLDFMTESDKGKLFDKLKEFNSFRDIERNLDDVMDYAKTLADVSDRRALAEQIDKEVRQTIHTWQNGIKKTKYTYPANKLFERLREINKMSSSTVQDMYDAYLNEEETPDYTDDTVHEKEYYSLIEELFVKYKINGVYYSSTEFLQDLLQRLQNAKYTAKIARDEIDFERRMKRLNKVDECAKALNERKSEIEENSAIKKVGKLNAAGFNFNGALKMIFNDSIKDWASLDYLYAKRDAQVGKDRKEFLEKAKKIFGYSGKFGDVKLFNRFIDMNQKYYTITQRHSPDIEQGSYRITSQMPETGFNATQYTQQVRQDMEFAEEWKPMQVELSKMEVLYYYIQAKNPTSYVILTDKDKGQFDKYDFDTMLDSLTEQEKLLGDVMQLAAEKYWNALNAYHVKKYHTDLGKVKGYFPRLSDTQDVKMLDMFNDYVAQTSNGKFQKQRTAGPGIRIKSANALAVLFDHIEKANTVITMGEHLDDINAVFSNPDLKKLMENIWGEDITKEFYGQLTGNLFTGQTLTKSLQEKWYGSVISNLIKTNLFLKPQIGIKQLISFMNYGKGDEYVSPEEWWSKFTKQALTPSEWKKNIDFMMENDYLRDRFYRGGSMDALKKDLDTRFFSKLSLLDEFWSKPIQLGDIGAIILGGKPYIDALMEKGYTKEQAFRIFIETTVNDQQSSIPSTLSNMQRNASKNPLAKMAFAYQNTPWQYYRQCTNAIMKALQTKEKPDIKRATKMLVLYGWLFPALFNMASSLSLLTFMGGGGDDDLLKDINPLRTITSVLTQHPILGEWIKGVLNATEGKQYYSNDLITKHVKSINKLIRDFKKDKLTLKDFWDCLIAFSESAGVPLGSLSNAASGIFDVIQGDVMKGTLKTLGYSDYKAKIVTGEE